MLSQNKSLDFPAAKNKSWPEITKFFPGELRCVLNNISLDFGEKISEIRLRANQALEIVCGLDSFYVTAKGSMTSLVQQGFLVSADLVRRSFGSFTLGSIYALENELCNGFLTLPGGFRVGFVGQVVHQKGQIELIRNVSGINFRIAKAFPGIARQLLPFLLQGGRFCKSIILAPPAAGKTTLLRELIRETSTGVAELGFPGIRVGVVDERSEIGGAFQGIAQFDLGPKTDVLDTCPKKAGVYLLLRSMNPELIATDEIGSDEDFDLLQDIINAGVSFITTAHAYNLSEALQRPGLKKILESGCIERIIILRNHRGIGSIESVRSGLQGPELFSSKEISKHD